MIQIPKGCKDVLPEDAGRWQDVECTARDVARRYGFQEIRTPTFEHTELFARGVGDTSDIVTKEMYTFLDKGGRSVTLRPEGTAGVARAFLEHGLAGGTMPFKAYYLISAFRYERPQAGRLREFHQFGAELYGSESPEADAEIIALAARFLKELQLSDVTLELNSIGCPECRKEYAAALKAYFEPHLAKMCPDCRVRYEKNPLRMLDCKVPECKEICKGAPRVLDHLCPDCRAHFAAVQRLLDAACIDYVVNPYIVRGLDYYSRTVFEFTSGALGAQNTVLAGGRYDTLLGQLGGKPVPAVGFAAGLERLILIMDAIGVPAVERCPDCIVMGLDDASRMEAFRVAEKLREAGFIAECDLLGRSLKAQMKYADKRLARYAVILGEEELSRGAAQVKHLGRSTSEEVPLEDLISYIRTGKLPEKE